MQTNRELNLAICGVENDQIPHKFDTATQKSRKTNTSHPKNRAMEVQTLKEKRKKN